jgi:hypothetical protein
MDNVSELKQRILEAIDRQMSRVEAQRAFTLPPQVVSPLNAFGGSADPNRQVVFATGYSGTETTVPFTWDMSLWGSGDIWTGS